MRNRFKSQHIILCFGAELAACAAVRPTLEQVEKIIAEPGKSMENTVDFVKLSAATFTNKI
jgi:hypothetical protein